MSHRGRSLARRNEGRERDCESVEGGCAKEIVKGPFGHVATGARRGRRMSPPRGRRMRFRRAWKGTGCGCCHPAGLRFSLSTSSKMRHSGGRNCVRSIKVCAMQIHAGIETDRANVKHLMTEKFDIICRMLHIC